MNYKNFSAGFLLTLFAALLSAGLMMNSDAAAVKTVDNSADSVKQNEKAIEYLKQNGSYDSLAEAFTTARYKIEQNGETLGANNQANQMQAQFDDSGNLRLSGTAQNWQTVFRLKSFGRGAQQSAVGGGTWQAKENRVENRRAEFGLTEYFENRPDGLEQGFILDAKPTGDENLSLILQTSGELKPAASADGQKIILSDASGAEVLHYDKLKVWDAENKDLTARMTTDEAGEIRLEVEDANAVYPLTIDPTFVQSQKLTANDGAANDNFGESVAISGDTVVVGSPKQRIGSSTQQGSAYVFVRNGSVWTQQAKLVANDGSVGDNFGNSVAISGDTIIVGSVFDDFNSQSDCGSAYIFVRNGTNWIPQEKLIATDAADSDYFGNSVSISGDTVLISALFDDVGTNVNQGSAYVFVRTGGAWTQQAKLTANDGRASDFFGNSVAISSSTVIIGAPEADINFNVDFGAAYIFTRSGTTWSQQAKLIASDGAAGDAFGSSVDVAVSITGTLAVVGASDDNIAGNLFQGSAYIFTRSQFGTWSQTQKLVAVDGSNNCFFGRAVSIDSVLGNTIIIGALNDNIGPNDNRGFAYIFKRDNSVWTQQQKLTANDGAAGDLFGGPVGISGDTVIAGADSDDVGSNNSQGSAYIFDLRDSIAPFDFDGDNKTDIGIFRPSNGQWWINRSSDSSTFATAFGLSNDKIMPADFTGDGKADITFFRPSNGQWFVLRSEDSTFYAFPFGANGDTPVTGDFDGDGKADAAVYRPSNLTWFISKSSGGTDIIGFGAANDKPVISDYDGDGRSDIAIFRNGANGAEWWIRRSSDATVFATQFGLSTDKPTQGDFTGDGKSDIAFFRPSNGNWFVLRSEDFSFFSFPFGANGDTPVAGNYDGDGKFDAGVFRPSNTTWYINRSTAGTLIQQFGQTGDKPVPNAFVP